jgi:hypothetical protein
MKKPCRLDGSTQQLKSLHHASQPRAGADISNASNKPWMYAWARPSRCTLQKKEKIGNLYCVPDIATFLQSSINPFSLI